MEPGNVLGVIAALLAYMSAKAGSVAMAIWLSKSAPSFSERALNAYQQRGKRCFALGVVNAFALFIVFIVCANAQIKPLGLVGVVDLAVLIAAVTVGYSFAYHDLGQRLRGEDNWSSTKTVLLGGISAEVAFMAPVIGQVFSIGVLFRGLGAVVSALLSRGK